MSPAAPPVSTGFPLVDRILEGKAPAEVRAAAARGALPLPREVLLLALVHLASDDEETIRTSAQQTLDGVPEAELAPILADPTTDPRVLSFFCLSPALAGEPLVGLIANPALEEEAIVKVASHGSSAAIDSLLLNQERLGRTPSAVEALTANTSLNADQRRRLLDFSEHLEEQVSTAPAEEAEAEALPPELLGPVSEAELRSLLGQLGDLPFINLEVGELMEEGGTIEWDEALEAEGPSVETVYRQILRMNPAQRLRAALRGGREARQILVRDTNRVVSSAVLRNPKLTEEEVVRLTAQKSLSEHLLRQIGRSRPWMGCYSIVMNLVRNPKTPQAIAMNNVPRLATRDLSLLARDRNVPEVIARAAKRHFEARQPKTISGRKR